MNEYLPPSYDDWRTMTPEEFMWGRRLGNMPDRCPGCGLDYYGGTREVYWCEQCDDAEVCQECGHVCECGKSLCSKCATEIEDMWLCAECLEEYRNADTQ